MRARAANPHPAAVPIERLIPHGDPRIRTDTERTIRGFRLIECSQPPALSIPDHFHGWGSVHFVRAGVVRDVYRGRPREAGPGEALYYAAGAPHRTLHPGASRLFHIAFPPGLDFGFDPSRAEHDPCALPSRIAGRAMAILVEHRRGPDRCSLALESLLAELLDEMFAREPASPLDATWLRRTVDLLHASRTRPLTLEALSREAGVSVCHFVRAFRQRFGVTPGHFQRDLRLQEAARRLAATRATIATIALDLGYTDQSHLTRDFTRRFGVPPRRYRQVLAVEPRARV